MKQANKTQSGAVLILIAVILNIGGRFLSEMVRDSRSVGMAGFVLILTFTSVVLGLFGLFRLISGAVSKK